MDVSSRLSFLSMYGCFSRMPAAGGRTKDCSGLFQAIVYGEQACRTSQRFGSLCRTSDTDSDMLSWRMVEWAHRAVAPLVRKASLCSATMPRAACRLALWHTVLLMK